MPEAIFDVVSEDPQVQHVSENVQPSAVQEHRRDERRRFERCWHDAEELHERHLRARPERELVQEDQRVHGDDEDRDDRRRARRNHVTERDHRVSIAKPMGSGREGGR